MMSRATWPHGIVLRIVLVLGALALSVIQTSASSTCPDLHQLCGRRRCRPQPACRAAARGSSPARHPAGESLHAWCGTGDQPACPGYVWWRVRMGDCGRNLPRSQEHRRLCDDDCPNGGLQLRHPGQYECSGDACPADAAQCSSDGSRTDPRHPARWGGDPDAGGGRERLRHGRLWRGERLGLRRSPRVDGRHWAIRITRRNECHQRHCGAGTCSRPACPTRDHLARSSTCRLCAEESSTASTGSRRNARARAIASSCGKASPDMQAAAKASSSKWARTAVTVVWRSRSSVGRGGAPVARRIVAALPRNQAVSYWLAAQRCEVRHALQALGHPQPRAEIIVQRQRIRIMERRHHRGTAVTGTIPQQRERVGEDASFVNRPQIAEGVRFEHRRAGREGRNGLGAIVPIIGHHIEVSKRQARSRLIAGLLIPRTQRVPR